MRPGKTLPDRRQGLRGLTLLFVLAASACPETTQTSSDASALGPDARLRTDAAADASAAEAGPADSARLDRGLADTLVGDHRSRDIATADSRVADATLPDATLPDSGPPQPLADGTCASPSPAHTVSEQTLRDLPADTWWQAPGSHMRQVCPDLGDANCNNAITAWNGGAYDPLHNRMLIFGGGHADYPGNELYAFELSSLTWTRLTDPSPVSMRNQDPLPDGQPVSRHSYDGLQYITQANRFFAVGGSRWRDGAGTQVTWTFESETTTWTNMQPANVPRFTNCCSNASAYDPATGLVFLHATNDLLSYSFANNSYQRLHDLGYPPLWPRYEVSGDKRCTVDTQRHVLWCLGSKMVLVYDISDDRFVTDDWVTTGGSPIDNSEQIGGHSEQLFATTGGEVVGASAPGVDYDPVADDLVAWVGGAPWILDLGNKHWSQGGASGAPQQPAAHGTFGRWRYVPRSNVFVLVNSADDNVYFYKHTAGCGE